MKENGEDKNQGKLEVMREEWSKEAAVKAKERARIARWDINIAILLFAVLIVVVILTYAKVRIELVCLLGFLGLVGCWFWAWRRERAIYPRFYDEELVNIVRREGTTKQEISVLMKLVAKEVSKGELVAKEEKRRVIIVKPALGRWALRATLIAGVILALVLAGGTAFAFAEPQHTLATPFKGVAITVAEASSAPVRLIEDIRGVVATYERNIVSTALQSMRVTEDLRDVPPITVPTNDMARFPSPEHPLFPQYLDKRFSQFRYTVDKDGIVSVDKSTATTDAFLKKIAEWLNRLKEEE